MYSNNLVRFLSLNLIIIWKFTCIASLWWICAKALKVQRRHNKILFYDLSGTYLIQNKHNSHRSILWNIVLIRKLLICQYKIWKKIVHVAFMFLLISAMQQSTCLHCFGLNLSWYSWLLMFTVQITCHNWRLHALIDRYMAYNYMRDY